MQNIIQILQQGLDKLEEAQEANPFIGHNLSELELEELTIEAERICR